MSYAMSSVNLPGLLQNLLNSSFNSKDCISELIDNATDAGATEVRITLIGNDMIVADNGKGMTRDQLGEAHVLHNRRGVSADHEGRFGIGGKHARSHFTQNKGRAVTFSKIENGPVHEVAIDYPDVIATGVMQIHVGGIQAVNVQIWDIYALSPTSGTVLHMNGDPTVITELKQRFQTSDVTQSMIYTLGSVYHAILQRVSIKVVCDGVERNVAPIDPLVWSAIPTTDRKEMYLNILSWGNAIHTYFKDGSDICSIDEDTTTTIPSDARKIGAILMRRAYSEDWEVQGAQLEANELKHISKGQKGVGAFREAVSGTFIVRNAKVITQLPPNKGKKGDKAAYKYVENMRHTIQFTASDEMDELFGVNTNKSRIDEKNIHPVIWRAIKALGDVFADELYKRTKKPDAASDSSSSEDAPVPNAPTQNPTPSAALLDVAVQMGAAAVLPAQKPKPDPIVPPAPKLSITFSKTPTEIVIMEHAVLLHKIPYFGQYCITEAYYKEHMMQLGVPLFKKWVAAWAKAGQELNG